MSRRHEWKTFEWIKVAKLRRHRCRCGWYVDRPSEMMILRKMWKSRSSHNLRWSMINECALNTLETSAWDTGWRKAKANAAPGYFNIFFVLAFSFRTKNESIYGFRIAVLVTPDLMVKNTKIQIRCHVMIPLFPRASCFLGQQQKFP